MSLDVVERTNVIKAKPLSKGKNEEHINKSVSRQGWQDIK